MDIHTKRHHTSRNGFSLVQVLVAMGLASAGFFVMMRQTDLQTKTQRSMYEHMDVQSFTKTINLHMNKSGNCTETLKGLDPITTGEVDVPDIKNSSAEIRFTPGGKTSGSKHGRIYLKSLKILKNGNVSASRLVDINLVATMEKSGKGYGNEVSQIVPLQVLLNPAPNNKILSCNDATTASSTPKGAIMAFNLASCPTDWSPADGNSGRPDLRGYFIRGLYSGRGLGSFQKDSLEKHSHTIRNLYRNTCLSKDNGSDDAKGFCRKSRIVWYDKTTDENDTLDANVDDETRPKNVAFLYCIKD